MAHSKHTIRNIIIGSVIAGVILFYLLPLDKFFIRIWEWLRVAVLFLWKILSFKIPIWIIITIAITIWIYINYKKQKHLNKKITKDISQYTQEIEFSELELKVIHALSLKDGGHMYLREIATTINVNKIRTQQAIENLIEKGFIQYNLNYVYGTSFYLNSNGRDLAIRKGFA